ALEAMAALGDQRAISYFVRDAFGGMGAWQAVALLALAGAPGDGVMPTLRSRLAGSPYLEAKLAAARSLGRHGSLLGYDVSLQALDWEPPKNDTPDEPPANRIMRVRTMAALALGEIGDA